MPTHLAKIRMDEEHSRAICAEIGDRLRTALRNSTPMPPHLANLVVRLSELDGYDSPSIVPSLEDAALGLAVPPVAAICR
jgi:hypothetical protein